MLSVLDTFVVNCQINHSLSNHSSKNVNTKKYDDFHSSVFLISYLGLITRRSKNDFWGFFEDFTQYSWSLKELNLSLFCFLKISKDNKILKIHDHCEFLHLSSNSIRIHYCYDHFKSLLVFSFYSICVSHTYL